MTPPAKGFFPPLLARDHNAPHRAATIAIPLALYVLGLWLVRDGEASPLRESLSASAVSWISVALFCGVDCPQWFLAL